MDIKDVSCQELAQKHLNVASSIFWKALPVICKELEVNSSTVEPFHEHFYNICCHLNHDIQFANTSHSENTTEEICKYYQSENVLLHRQYCSHYPEQRNDYLPFMYAVLIILSPLGLFANTLIMMTVYKVKRLRNTTGYFICNLAFADVLLIIDMLLFFIFDQTSAMSKTSSRVRKFIFPSIDIFLGSASLLLVTAVSVERGIAVARPLKYPRYLSEKRAKVLVLSIWIYCFLLLIFGVLRIWIKNQHYCKILFYITVTLSFFIPCIFVITSYNVIVFSALKTMKMEKKICKVIVAISILNDQKLDQATTVRPNRCRELKVAVKVAALTIPFVCGWGYFMVSNVYELAASYRFQGMANVMILFLPYIIACLNPLTYLMFTRTLRQSTWMILSRSNTCMKIFKLLCRQRREKPTEQPIRARLLPRDRLKQMQFTEQHSKWLETKQAQTVI